MEEPTTEVVFDPLDAVDATEGAELLVELRDVGVEAEVHSVDGLGVVVAATVVAMVTMASTTVTGLCVVVVFLHRAFEVGVVVDASRKRVHVSKDRSLPKGSVLTIPREGEPTLTRNASGEVLQELMKNVLGRSSSSDQDN